MDKFRHIWRGQLLVGMKDIGQATIWTTNNSYLPPIGWNLKMTYITEYSDLWSKVLDSEPTVLSQESYTKIKDKYVSLFTITSSTPEFLQLTKELNQFNKARIILTMIPKDTEITLIPHCKETMRLGMWEPPEEYRPFLYMMLISKMSPKKAMKQHRKHYLQVMSQMNQHSTPHPLLKEKKADKELPRKESKGSPVDKNSHKTRKMEHPRSPSELRETVHESKTDKKLDRERRKADIYGCSSGNDKDKRNDEHRRKESSKGDKERDKDRVRDKKDTHFDKNRKERKDEKENDVERKHRYKKREEEQKEKGIEISHQKIDRREKSDWKEKEKRSRTSPEKGRSDESRKIQKEQDNYKHKADKTDIMEKTKKNDEENTLEKIKTMESSLKSAIKNESKSFPKELKPINSVKIDKGEDSGKNNLKYLHKSEKPFDKKSLLDTKKLNMIFSSKDKKRPDLIKPSMLKRSAKRDLDQALKTVTPDLIASSEPSCKIPGTNTQEPNISGGFTNMQKKTKNSVKDALKGTLKRLTSTSEEQRKGSKEKSKVKSKGKKGISQDECDELTSPRSKSSVKDDTNILDNSIETKEEVPKIQEETVPVSAEKLLTSTLSFHPSATPPISLHKNEEPKEKRDLESTTQSEEEPVKEHYDRGTEKDSKSNVKDALDNFKEFFNSKLGKKRKSECTEKSLQEMQSPSKKPRVINLTRYPIENNILNTPQASCYPNIFKNIKHKYKNSLLRQHHETTTKDELGRDIPEGKVDDAIGLSSNLPELVELSTSTESVDPNLVKMLQYDFPDRSKQVIETEPVDLFLQKHEPLDLTLHNERPLNLSLHETTSEADVIQGEENSLAETVSWKGVAEPETTINKTPCSKKGKEYILDMFLNSVQDGTCASHRVSGELLMTTQESSPVQNIVSNASTQDQKVEGDQILFQKEIALNDKSFTQKDATYVYHKDDFHPDLPNKLPLQIQYPMPCVEIQGSEKFPNLNHFPSCKKGPLPGQTGIPNQDLGPGHKLLGQSLGQSSSDQLFIDEQLSGSYQNDDNDHPVDLRLMISGKQSVHGEYFTTDKLLDKVQLPDSEYPITKQFLSPERGFANAAAHSSPRMVIKGELQSKVPVIHPLPGLPPLTRLSDLRPTKRKPISIQDPLVSGTVAEYKSSSSLSSNWLPAAPSNSRSSLTGESVSSHGIGIDCKELKSSEIIDIFNQRDHSKPESFKANESQEACIASCSLETIDQNNFDTSLEKLSTSVSQEIYAAKFSDSFEISPNADIKENYLLKTSFASSNLNNSTVSRDVFSQSNSSLDSVCEAGNTFVNAKSTCVEPLVLQQLKKKINFWQDKLYSKSNIPLTNGITALSDFMKKPTVIPPEIKKGTVILGDEVAKSSLHMKKVLLGTLLGPSKKNQQLDEQVSKKVVALVCKEKCCVTTNACLPKPLSPNMKTPYPENLESLRGETQGQRKLIENKKVLLTLLEPSELTWDDAVSGISKSSLQSSKYIHLFNANESDVLKAKIFCRAHQMTYATLDGLVTNGGYMLVQHSSVRNLLSSPDLILWCTQPNIKFGVYTSLSSLLNNKVSPVMTSKWLLLLHHTAMVDPFLVTVLERELKDWNSDTSHHPNIVIPIRTLKICYCSLLNSARADAVERSACKILQKNIVLLIKCLGSGVAKLIDEDCSWGGVGPESSIHMHLQCLRVIHYNFRLAHRHALLLIGERVQQMSVVDPFYKVQTVGKFVKTQ